MNKDYTDEMIQHFKQEWVRDDVYIVFPKAFRRPSEKWDSINRDDIQIVKQQQYDKSQYWELIVHKIFRFGVVKNFHGYHIEQLEFKITKV